MFNNIYKERFFKEHFETLEHCTKDQLVELLVDHENKLKELDHAKLLNMVKTLDLHIYKDMSDSEYAEMCAQTEELNNNQEK